MKRTFFRQLQEMLVSLLDSQGFKALLKRLNLHPASDLSNLSSVCVNLSQLLHSFVGYLFSSSFLLWYQQMNKWINLSMMWLIDVSLSVSRTGVSLECGDQAAAVLLQLQDGHLPRLVPYEGVSGLHVEPGIRLRSRKKKPCACFDFYLLMDP